jgi:hypothetical protein
MPTASDRQITANRRNAKKSTGPRSKAGREAARHNALRHGLAIAIGNDPAFRGDIEKLVRALSSGKQEVSDFAREAAEAELEVLRIRKIRAWLFDKFYLADTSFPARLAALSENLAKLERYERRAFSRRKRALRAVSQAG